MTWPDRPRWSRWREFVGDVTTYPVLSGLSPISTAASWLRTWTRTASPRESRPDPPRDALHRREGRGLRGRPTAPATALAVRQRAAALREIDHHVSYGVHVYGSSGTRCAFLNAAGLYHPETVRAFARSTTARGPSQGSSTRAGWDRPPAPVAHPDGRRRQTLCIWRDVLEAPTSQCANADALHRQQVVGGCPRADSRSRGECQNSAFDSPADGTRRWTARRAASSRSGGRRLGWTPSSKARTFTSATRSTSRPNPTMMHNQDWSSVDLETLAPDAQPVTAYKPAGDRRSTTPPTARGTASRSATTTASPGGPWRPTPESEP